MKKSTRKRRLTRGFGLIDMTITMALLSTLLTTMVVPMVVSKRKIDLARRIAVDIEAIQNATLRFAQDHEGKWPGMTSPGYCGPSPLCGFPPWPSCDVDICIGGSTAAHTRMCHGVSSNDPSYLRVGYNNLSDLAHQELTPYLATSLKDPWDVPYLIRTDESACEAISAACEAQSATCENVGTAGFRVSLHPDSPGSMDVKLHMQLATLVPGWIEFSADEQAGAFSVEFQETLGRSVLPRPLQEAGAPLVGGVAFDIDGGSVCNYEPNKLYQVNAYDTLVPPAGILGNFRKPHLVVRLEWDNEARVLDEMSRGESWHTGNQYTQVNWPDGHIDKKDTILLEVPSEDPDNPGTMIPDDACVRIYNEYFFEPSEIANGHSHYNILLSAAADCVDDTVTPPEIRCEVEHLSVREL